MERQWILQRWSKPLTHLGRTGSLDTQVGFEVVNRRRIAGVGHTLYGLGDTADEQAITRPTNR